MGLIIRSLFPVNIFWVLARLGRSLGLYVLWLPFRYSINKVIKEIVVKVQTAMGMPWETWITGYEGCIWKRFDAQKKSRPNWEMPIPWRVPYTRTFSAERVIFVHEKDDHRARSTGKHDDAMVMRFNSWSSSRVRTGKPHAGGDSLVQSSIVHNGRECAAAGWLGHVMEAWLTSACSLPFTPPPISASTTHRAGQWRQ